MIPEKNIYHYIKNDLTLHLNRWCFSMVPKHWLDKIVQMKISENVETKFWIFHLYFVIKSTFCYCRKTPFMKYTTLNCLWYNIKYFSRRLNASSWLFFYDYIESQLKIVRYEIGIYVWFILDFFCKSIKKSEPKYEPELPYTNTEGLGNVIWL